MLDVILRLVGDYLLMMFSMQELLTVTPLFYFIFLGQRLITFNDSTLQCKDWSTIGIHLVPVAFLQQFKRFLRQEWVVDKSTIHCNFVLRWDWEIESAVSCIVDTAIGANSNFLVPHIYSCTRKGFLILYKSIPVQLPIGLKGIGALTNSSNMLNSPWIRSAGNSWATMIITWMAGINSKRQIHDTINKRDLITSNKVDFSFLPSKI